MLTSLRERFLRRRLYERIRAELSQHGHRELYDLGIGPGDIEGVAKAGAYGPQRAGNAPSRSATQAGHAANS